MLIDPILPKVLLGRGMSRGEAAAALRCHQETLRYTREPEAEYAIKKALGSPILSDGDYGQVKYDIAIGKGVRLMEHKVSSTGTVTGTTVVIDRVLPTTVVTALLHKELHHLIDHPMLPRDAIIYAIRTKPDETEVDIMSMPQELAVVLPATQSDLARARRTWARTRREEVREAGAIYGMCPWVVKRALKRASTPAAVVISCVMTTWFATDGGGGTGTAVRHATMALAVLVLAGIATWTLLRMRHDAGREDDGLIARLDDLRSRRIMERRRAILTGTDKT